MAAELEERHLNVFLLQCSPKYLNNGKVRSLTGLENQPLQVFS
jgi:hypothetical protein